MPKTENKIDANDRSVLEVLDKKKYTVDYFQREYSWEEKHIQQLVTDLTDAFLACYDPNHPRSEVADYNTYYLGPFVLSEKDGLRSIIDGQQRLTSLTLFLIYLHHAQKELGVDESVESMVFSEKFGQKSFNITVEERIPCLQSLFERGNYEPNETDSESTRNMVERYNDIETVFPDKIDGHAFPYFIDWLKERVVLVEIVAYSDDNAYTIFETMNDRGLNLTPTEMLKGFILSRIKSPKDRHAADQAWKQAMKALHEYEGDEDQAFFQAWLRAQYAETIRQSKAGSTNEDFEKIGTRFHSWFRDNLKLMNLRTDSSEDFTRFLQRDFKFFLDANLLIAEAQNELHEGLEHAYYIDEWGIAESLSYPLMLAPLTLEDPAEIVRQKVNLVAKYIEIFSVRRSVNFKNFGASSIRYTMYSLVKEIRRKPLPELKGILARKLAEMEQTWDGVESFYLHGMNRNFVKFLLARISGYIDQECGLSTDFETYYFNPGGKPFEVEHIWADRFEEHRDEFVQRHEFEETRNRLGDLVLLPRGTNQSYGALPYTQKLPHYLKENLLVKSLCALTYKNNPNFVQMTKRLNLPFRAHDQFKKSDIETRQRLYRALCEQIWSLESAG
jgi:uncharacterized protein with ParB-like and HNH nuclease domain